ncbi:hypothetical protein JK635_04130 [Neobacillus sp. YIM B02564]|uniref:Uncharacterized protein n=1 Tax=Neobacillus paridis TaxID=2803862 RepID=A0ABS1TJC8_9BACI|nr:hypothetical protein [Neobacillus paridis]MBL4951429.1 hypothetical protein [Neobacillus paridis]
MSKEAVDKVLHAAENLERKTDVITRPNKVLAFNIVVRNPSRIEIILLKHLNYKDPYMD